MFNQSEQIYAAVKLLYKVKPTPSFFLASYTCEKQFVAAFPCKPKLPFAPATTPPQFKKQ